MCYINNKKNVFVQGVKNKETKICKSFINKMKNCPNIKNDAIKRKGKMCAAS